MRAIEARRGLVEEVHERLIQAISDGGLAPGARLGQEEVAERLQVSRQPVSHALALLKRQGLAVEQGRRGLIVAPLDPRRIHDLYQVRAVLDGLAARLAASRRLSSQEQAELKSAQARGEAALEAGDLGELLAADVAFHDCIHDLCGNPAVADTARDMWPHFRRGMGAVLAHAGPRSRVWREHAAILAAILAGNAGTAERLAQEHAHRAGAEILERLTDETIKEGGARATAPKGEMP